MRSLPLTARYRSRYPRTKANGFAAVRQALLALPDIYRDVIFLHRWHDLGFAEIAEIPGLTESTVKVRAYRGYLQLRKTLLAAKDS